MKNTICDYYPCLTGKWRRFQKDTICTVRWAIIKAPCIQMDTLCTFTVTVLRAVIVVVWIQNAVHAEWYFVILWECYQFWSINMGTGPLCWQFWICLKVDLFSTVFSLCRPIYRFLVHSPMYTVSVSLRLWNYDNGGFEFIQRCK